MREKYYQVVFWLWMVGISALIISALLANIFE